MQYDCNGIVGSRLDHPRRKKQFVENHRLMKSSVSMHSLEMICVNTSFLPKWDLFGFCLFQYSVSNLQLSVGD